MDTSFEIYEGGSTTCPTCNITMSQYEYDNHDCER